MNHTFWRSKQVLVTGHTGFKGAWLALWLHRMGAQVYGFSLAPNKDTPNLFSLCKLDSLIAESSFGDITDQSALSHFVKKAAPEVVFHLAAQSLVRRSYHEPTLTYATNVLGLVNLFEAVRQTPSIKVLVNVTSDKCYENKEWLWGYREEDRLGGKDPYSSSKACAELVSSAYHDSYFSSEATGPAPRHHVKLATARAGNVIGGGDWCEDRIIPDIVRAIGAGTPLTLRNPAATRPWQHVLEPLAGYLQLAEYLHSDAAAQYGAWNFGPSPHAERSVLKVVEEFYSLWGIPAAVTINQSPAVHEAHMLKIDSSKARTFLNWSPRLTLSQALRFTVEWYSAVEKDPSCAAQSVTEQIAHYEKLPHCTE